MREPQEGRGKAQGEAAVVHGSHSLHVTSPSTAAVAEGKATGEGGGMEGWAAVRLMLADVPPSPPSPLPPPSHSILPPLSCPPPSPHHSDCRCTREHGLLAGPSAGLLVFSLAGPTAGLSAGLLAAGGSVGGLAGVLVGGSDGGSVGGFAGESDDGLAGGSVTKLAGGSGSGLAGGSVSGLAGGSVGGLAGGSIGVIAGPFLACALACVAGNERAKG
ncbi:unnamed protein product [Closterium sp. Naga37s-1]|nr:unnamed protein product [Closterium sp. Naga37s-1]